MQRGGKRQQEKMFAFELRELGISRSGLSWPFSYLSRSWSGLCGDLACQMSLWSTAWDEKNKQ